MMKMLFGLWVVDESVERVWLKRSVATLQALGGNTQPHLRRISLLAGGRIIPNPSAGLHKRAVPG